MTGWSPKHWGYQQSAFFNAKSWRPLFPRISQLIRPTILRVPWHGMAAWILSSSLAHTHRQRSTVSTQSCDQLVCWFRSQTRLLWQWQSPHSTISSFTMEQVHRELEEKLRSESGIASKSKIYFSIGSVVVASISHPFSSLKLLHDWVATRRKR